jgi:DNA repair protein RecN (Recombination protein N)
MLRFLYAKDFALIHEIKVTFGNGLNIITGETGAGKSILIGALGALLGDRLGKDVIRQGSRKGIVEGVFQIQEGESHRAFFQERDLEWFDEEIIVRREISTSGRNRCFINDTPVNVSDLAALGEMMVELHGQHEHQSLLHVSKHVQFLDDYAHLSDQVEQVTLLFSDVTTHLRELSDLLDRKDELKQSQERIQFQLKEINSVDPQPEEDKTLRESERIAGSAETLYEHSVRVFQTLYEEEGSTSERVAQACRTLKELAEIDPSFAAMVSECENAQIIVDELATSLQHYASSIEFDPAHLESIRERLALIRGLEKKYGGSLEAVLAQRDQLKKELDLIENLDEAEQSLRRRVDEIKTELSTHAQELSRARQTAADTLSRRVVETLGALGMENVRFAVSLDQKETIQEPSITLDGKTVQVGPKGIDHAEFLISSNPGENVKPLVKVASGGEISRIMLALKSLLADADRIPLLVFDEIDLGISGRIAQSVGSQLRRLADSHQVICITHLPQIASMAHHHFLVEKTQGETETHTSIRELNDQDRTEQVARLFGGETVTDTHLSSARQLIHEADALDTD